MFTRFMVALVLSVAFFIPAYAADEAENILDADEINALAAQLIAATEQGNEDLIAAALAQLSSACGGSGGCYDAVISVAKTSSPKVAETVVASIEATKISNIAPAAGPNTGVVNQTGINNANRGRTNSPIAIFVAPPPIENPAQVSTN